MGLFDYLKCEYSLPDGGSGEDLSFQTKSFYWQFEKYVITKEGKLIHDPNLWGKATVAFDGEFSFYTSKGSREDRNFEWLEYSARFVGGQLETINRK